MRGGHRTFDQEPPSKRIQFYLRGLDHAIPFDGIGAHERAKTLGRVFFE
jgi:hypothetical protein